MGWLEWLKDFGAWLRSLRAGRAAADLEAGAEQERAAATARAQIEADQKKHHDKTGR